MTFPFPKTPPTSSIRRLVEHLKFNSRTEIPTLAADFVKLDAQGWKKGDVPDLVTQGSAIIARKRGEAGLTIMVQPAGKGSQVMMMTSGLDWEEKPKDKKEDK